MAFWDLSAAQREELKLRLTHRTAHLELGLPTPNELELESLKKEFALTEADMKAVLKGNETWSQESQESITASPTPDT